MPGSDFNGDGRDDILWRNSAGEISQWLAQPDGSFTWNPAVGYHLGTDWNALAIGDFDGNGTDDIVWRRLSDHGDGFGTGYAIYAITGWLGQEDGSFIWTPLVFSTFIDQWNSQIGHERNRVAVMDQKDGGDVILLPDPYRGWDGYVLAAVIDDGVSGGGGNAFGELGGDWSLVGTGDFNGDGVGDILWRDSSGNVSEWLVQTDEGAWDYGYYRWNPSAAHQLPTNWEIAGIGDFNGDSRDDILWRNEVGALSEWLAQPNGSFAWNPAVQSQLADDWQVISTGDYNGDGRDDLLLRRDDGVVTNWLGQANGSLVSNHALAAYALPVDWVIAGTSADGIWTY